MQEKLFPSLLKGSTYPNMFCIKILKKQDWNRDQLIELSSIGFFFFAHIAYCVKNSVVLIFEATSDEI